MSRLQLVITSVVVIGTGCGSLAWSQDKAAGSGTLRERLMKQFDEDGDGKLSPSEEAKVREAFLKSRAALRERPGQTAFDREAIMKRFDKDGDGQLNADERAAAQAAMAMFRGGPRFAGASDQPAEPRKSRVDLKDLLEKFDADGDGKLNEAERAKAKEVFQQRTKNATP